MSATHPRLVRHTVLKCAAGRRYEVTPDNAYVLGVRTIFHSTTIPSSYPYLGWDGLGPIRVSIGTYSDRDSAVGEAHILSAVSAEQPLDNREWAPEQAVHFTSGIYIEPNLSFPLPDGSEAYVEVEVTWVKHGDLCPANQPIAAWREGCGYPSQRGNERGLDPWTDQGAVQSYFLVNPEGGYLRMPGGGGRLKLMTTRE